MENNEFIKPKFRYSNHYYYDIENNIIYGKEKYSLSYWHEYRHYMVNCKKGFYKFNIKLSMYVQFILTIMPLYYIMSFIMKADSKSIILSALIFVALLSFPSGFILAQELDAEIFAYKKKYFKRWIINGIFK